MKENLLGPRQWAFVVITGGAACALPFLQTDSPPTRTDSASTTSPQDLALDVGYPLAGAAARGESLVAASPVSHLVPPLPTPRLPEWASADRSPFDDLVGVTAAKPAPAPPDDQIPMQPLRPWIAAPGDATPLAVNDRSIQPAAPFEGDRGAIARREPDAVEASPWSDEPMGAGSAPQSDSDSFRQPFGGLAASDFVATNHRGGESEDQRWPDQTVSAEEIAQATRTRDRELASAVVRPPRPPADPNSSLLAVPTIPAAASSPAISTVPVAAHRFGQAYMPPQSPTLRTTTLSEPNRAQPPDAHGSNEPLARDSGLPALPATRKSHIIFQPGNWK